MNKYLFGVLNLELNLEFGEYLNILTVVHFGLDIGKAGWNQ